MQIPQLMDHKDYRAAWDRLQELRLDLSQIEREIQDLDSRTSRERDFLENAARGLIDGKPISRHEHEGERLKLYDRRGICRRAVEIQQRTVSELEAQACREICAKLKPTYDKHDKAIGVALLALAEAIDAEREMLDQCRMAGITNVDTLKAQPFHVGGQIRKHHNRIAVWFREAIRNGHFDIDDVPQRFREWWMLDHFAACDANPTPWSPPEASKPKGQRRGVLGWLTSPEPDAA